MDTWLLGWVISQVDNWRFPPCWRRSPGVMCMSQQPESDSLPLPLSLSSRVVIELPAGVRPTGGVTLMTGRFCICTALRWGGHPVAIRSGQVRPFRCDIFTNPTLHPFPICCQRCGKLMYYEQLLWGKLVKVGADALGGHFTAPGACWRRAAVATMTGGYAAFVRTPQRGFFSVDPNQRFLFISK